MIQTWMGRSAPDELEGVGGPFLAVLQFAFALGAIAGGTAFDLYGVGTPLYMTARAEFSLLPRSPVRSNLQR
jgi:DHA1 family purine ribonucleoside efflux pump-like MFS transporter